MTDLVEFLWARYAEARDRQMRTVRDTWEYGAECPVCHLPTESMSRYGGSLSLGPLASFKPCRHEVYDPALLTRFDEPNPDQDVLADLGSKDALLRIHARLDDLLFCVTCDAPSGIPGRPLGCDTLRYLAVPFAAHPDYDERWRP